MDEGESVKKGTTVAAAIGPALRGLGPRYCFGIVGTANFKFTHSLITAGVGSVAARHECNAVAMADAFAKATGELTLDSLRRRAGDLQGAAR